MKITFTVNGTTRTVDTHPLARLLDLLRDDLSLKGCKEGCGEGECGACSIIMDGQLVNACMIPALQAAGSTLLTIEGLEQNGQPDALQQAFIDEGAVHCGFCTPGMILAARAMLHEQPHPTLTDTRIGLSGNLCRCTGYGRIYAAVDKAVQSGYKPLWEQRPGSDRPVFSEAEKESFFSPATLEEALEILDQHPDILLLSGGTDTGPDMKSGKLRPEKAMDIFTLRELKGISLQDGNIHIGSAATDAEMTANPLVSGHLPALCTAAAMCAAPAVRNRATIGGNLCTASGAADLPVALMALGAQVKVRGKKSGERSMPVWDFIRGYRKVDLQHGELLVEIIIPLPKENSVQTFYKRGSRAALTLSRVSLSMFMEIENGRILEARAAAGSMSPVPVRLPELEAALRQQTLDSELVARAVETVRAEVNPRKSPAYRKALTGNLVRRFLEETASRQKKGLSR